MQSRDKHENVKYDIKKKAMSSGHIGMSELDCEES